MKKILIIEALGSGNGLALIEQALATGADVVFAVESASRYVFDLRYDIVTNPPRNLTIVEGIHTTDVDEVVSLLSGANGEGAAVISQVDRTIIAVADACARTGHQFLAASAARLCADKALFRSALRESGVPSPESAVITDLDGLENAVRQVGLPAVAKPSRGTGSSGVRLVWTMEEVRDHVAAILEGGMTVLLESYLLGPLVSTEVFRYGDETVFLGATDRVLSDAPFFAELSWTFPLEISSLDRAILESEVSRVLDAVGFDRGPAHLEFIQTADGPVIVEVNPRIAGRGLTAMVSELSSFNEYELIVSHALGLSLPAPRLRQENRFLSECVITGPSGSTPDEDVLSAVSTLPGVLHIRMADPSRPTQTLGWISDLGEVRAEGASFGQAQMRARAAAQAVTASFGRTDRARNSSTTTMRAKS